MAQWVHIFVQEDGAATLFACLFAPGASFWLLSPLFRPSLLVDPLLSLCSEVGY
jgi:hypothetical protein